MKRVIYLIVCLVILGLTVSIPLSLSAKDLLPSITSAAFDWQISKAQVVDPGKTRTTKKGTLTNGYVIEAVALANSSDAPIKKGTFRITANAFLPAEDMPGQKAGNWYVRGNWSITDEEATEKEKEARHSAGVVTGNLFATLDFNPCESAGPVSAQVLFPMTPNGGVWARGEGTFIGNEKFEGSIVIDANVWPDVAKIKGVEK
jgi:hypothetical protein